MPPFTTDEWLGTASLEPNLPVVAGAVGTWRLTYTAGRYGVDEGGTLRIARRFCSDSGTPQFDNPEAPDYATVTLRTDGTAQFRVRYDPKAGVRPWQKCVVIDLYDGSLAEGDRVVLVFGDRSGGSPGFRMQTFCESKHQWRVLADCFGTGQFHRLSTSPIHAVVPGGPAKLVAIGRRFGEQQERFVKAEDAWGNPVRDYQATHQIEPLEVPEPLVLPELNRSAASESLRTQDRVRVLDPQLGLEAVTNPTHLNCWTCCDGTVLHALWGDPHGQTEETVGTGSLEEYFRFARHWSGLDYTGHQGNDFQITDAFWRRLTQVVQEFNEEGRFVVFLGEEWSGNTPAGGDRNVYFLEGAGPLYRSSRWQVEHPADASEDAYPVTELFARLRKLPRRADGRAPALVVPHVGGRYANLAFHDEALEPVIEVCSSWGVFEWMIDEALERGYRVGFVAASDGHKGRPGSAYPGAGTFGIYGGLTCCWAPERTRCGIWDGYFARRTVATTGARLVVQVEARGEGQEKTALLGDLITYTPELTVYVRVAGTAPLDTVEVFRGCECVKRWLICQQPAQRSDQIQVVWSGARLRGRGRQVRWDGQLRVSGARIRDARAYSFDLADEGIVQRTETTIAWRSSTTGDQDGVILDLSDVSADATLAFQSPPVETEWKLDQIGLEPLRHPVGGEKLELEVRRLPAGPRPWDADLETAVTIPDEGAAVWLRVTQIDGHRAWASPVFVGSKANGKPAAGR